MELLQYWKIIRRRFWVILLLDFVGVLSALWYTSAQPAVFTATAVLMINPAYPITSYIPITPAEAEASVAGLAATYVRFMETRAFAQLVSDRLGGVIPAEAIPGAINARAVPGTRFFEITAVSRQPDVAAALANAAADIFISQNPQTTRVEKNAVAVEMLAEQQGRLQTRITDLQAQIETFQVQPQTRQTQEQIEKLEAQLVSAQETFVRILETLANVQTGPQTSAVLIDTALPASRPRFANRTQNVIFAVLASSGLAIALVFLMEYLDTAVTVRRPEDLDQALGVPLLGVVGILARDVTERDRLVTVSHPRSPNAEAFHSIGANLKLSRAGSGVRTMLVTSPGPSEGKTLTAVNLAVALAEGGDRVMLIDADLRRPSVHKYFGMSNGVGLTNYLMSGADTAAEYLQATIVENLWVLPSGPQPPRPQVLLSLPRMAQLISDLKLQADLIIIDSPPVMAVADAVVLSSRVDGVLIVAMAGRTVREMLVRTKEMLANVGAVLVGSVLNKVRSSDLGSYYLYYYYRQSHRHPILRPDAGGERLLPAD